MIVTVIKTLDLLFIMYDIIIPDTLKNKMADNWIMCHMLVVEYQDYLLTTYIILLQGSTTSQGALFSFEFSSNSADYLWHLNEC